MSVLRKKYSKDEELLKKLLKKGYKMGFAPFNMPDGERPQHLRPEEVEKFRVDFENAKLYTSKGVMDFEFLSLTHMTNILYEPINRVRNVIIFKFHYKLELKKPGIDIIIADPSDHSLYHNPKEKLISEIASYAESKKSKKQGE